jgi:integrase
MLAQNVVKFESESTKIYSQIEKFLTKHEYNSKGTARAYKYDIEMFFREMKGKELQHLTREDVQITYDDFEDFIQKLFKAEEDGERTFSNKTINRKVVAVKSLLRYLAGKKIVDDISYLNLIESLPEHSISHGVLESNEVFEMAELARYEGKKGEVFRLMILFSLDTCARKAECLSMKWSNFIEKPDGVLVKNIGKGNKEFRQLISKDFYKELLTLKEDGVDKVFQIGDRTVDRMMASLKEKMQIPEDRHISFHSIRKSGVTFRFRLTQDILEAKRAANHSNINTTMLYLQEEDYGALGAVSSAGKLDMNLYKEVENYVLVKAIEMCKRDFQVLLNLKIQEILNKNN